MRAAGTKRRKNRKEGNALFNDALNTFYSRERERERESGGGGADAKIDHGVSAWLMCC